MGDEIYAYAFGAYQPHNELDALKQDFGCFVKQQVGFVKEKNQFGFFQVAHFGQLLKQLREHPQQKRGIQARGLQQAVGGEYVDYALAVYGLHQVVDVEHGFAKKLLAALRFNLQQTTLNSAHACRADVAVRGAKLARIVAHILQQAAQVFQIKQQQAVVICHLKDNMQHASLYFV